MTIRFTLRQLEYFVAVGETGSITHASERLNVSSPSISMSVSQLETELGIQLFIRKHARGLSLTPGGRRLLAESQTLLKSAEDLSNLATDISEKCQRASQYRLPQNNRANGASRIAEAV